MTEELTMSTQFGDLQVIKGSLLYFHSKDLSSKN